MIYYGCKINENNSSYWVENSGKTTLVSNLVNHLNEKFKVGVVKHAHHTFDIDHPNTDSYKIRSCSSKLQSSLKKD